MSVPKRAILSIVLCFLFSGVIFLRIVPVLSQTESEIAQQKAQKNQELQTIINEINAIASSKSSLSEKIKKMEEERKNLDSAAKAVQEELKKSEELTAQEEENFKKTSEQIAYNHALFYVESQKNLGIMLFESQNIRDLFDRMLYFSVQERLISEERTYILTKKQGIDNQKAELLAEQQALQKSLDDVNKTIAQLYVEQEQLNTRYRQANASKSLLTSDIANLSKQEQAILNQKAANANPPTNGTTPGTGGAGSGSGSTPPPTGSVVSNGAIDVYVDNQLVISSNNPIKISAQNNGDVLVNYSSGNDLTSPLIPYRGTVEFNKSARRTFTGAEGTKTVQFVNDLPMDEYLLGLGEMPSSWGSNGGGEALKAQAVAGRTYALRKMMNTSGLGYDILDTTDDQNYVGIGKIYNSYGGNWSSAVAGTSKMVVTVNGNPVETYYSSSSGGYGLSSQEVWGGYRSQAIGGPDRREINGEWQDYGLNVPGSSTSYWKPGGDDSYDNVMTYINAVLFLNLNIGVSSTSQRQMLTNGTNWKGYLGENTAEAQLGTLESIVQEYDSGGAIITQNTKWTKEVKVTGTNGTLTLNGSSFKTVYNLLSPGRNALWSTLYDIKKVSDSVWQFYSRGYGHRIGMSQYGAYGRSRAGQDYQTILKAYYNGVDIVQYNIGRNVRVGVTKAGGQTTYTKSTQKIDLYEGSTLKQTVSPNTTIKIVYK